MKIDIGESVLKLTNNPRIKDNINKYNYEREIIGDELFQNLGLKYLCLIGHEHLLLMFQLGVPIGIVHSTDENGDYPDDYHDPVGKITHIYKPINDISEYWEFYYEHDCCVDLRVHPDFLPKEKVNHLAYCIQFSNNREFFDIETMNKMQDEIIDSCPLDYDRAMKIFNKYYTRDVCNIFIKEKGVAKDHFFYISGLDGNKMGEDYEDEYNISI